MTRRGVYPGSFNPPTVAHLAIAEAACEQHNLDRIDLVVSVVALAKEDVIHPRFDHRMDVLTEVASSRPWLEASVTEHQLLADISDGYDLLVVGADKWNQIQELRWYADAADRAAQLDRLPPVAVVDRPPHRIPPELRLALPEERSAMLAEVSSTGARSGNLDWMADEARHFAERSGAWIDPSRYQSWLATLD